MIDEILLGSVTGFVSVSLTLAVASWALRKQLALEQRWDEESYTFSMLYRVGCLVLLTLVLVSSYALVVQNKDTGGIWELVSALWLLVVLPWGCYLAYNAFVYEVRIEADGICSRKLLASRKITWEEIEKIVWKDSSRAFVIVGSRGRHLRIGIFTLGIESLFQEIHTRAPSIDISVVQSKLNNLR